MQIRLREPGDSEDQFRRGEVVILRRGLRGFPNAVPGLAVDSRPVWVAPARLGVALERGEVSPSRRGEDRCPVVAGRVAASASIRPVGEADGCTANCRWGISVGFSGFGVIGTGLLPGLGWAPVGASWAFGWRGLPGEAGLRDSEARLAGSARPGVETAWLSCV